MTDPALNRLRWRCQRGMLELDQVLGTFLDKGYANASPAIRHAFETLLAREDAEIFDLLMGRVPPPPDLAELVPLLRRADR